MLLTVEKIEHFPDVPRSECSERMSDSYLYRATYYAGFLFIQKVYMGEPKISFSVRVKGASRQPLNVVLESIDYVFTSVSLHFISDCICILNMRLGIPIQGSEGITWK